MNSVPHFFCIVGWLLSPWLIGSLEAASTVRVIHCDDDIECWIEEGSEKGGWQLQLDLGLDGAYSLDFVRAVLMY